jgi:hypothetical protein
MEHISAVLARLSPQGAEKPRGRAVPVCRRAAEAAHRIAPGQRRDPPARRSEIGSGDAEPLDLTVLIEDEDEVHHVQRRALSLDEVQGSLEEQELLRARHVRE